MRQTTIGKASKFKVPNQGDVVIDPQRRARALRFTLLCLLLPANDPELVMLHKCFDSWGGIRQMAVGLKRRGLNMTLTEIEPREWRCALMGDNLLLAPRGYGVAPTPWRAVQMAGWAALSERRCMIDHWEGG